jgi:hypothetical protein
MSENSTGSPGRRDRFPGFDVMAQSMHWDAVTRSVIEDRLTWSGTLRFFTPTQARCARALFDELLDQTGGPRIPVLEMVDERLANGETDGWHYDTMPSDSEAWVRTLASLDADAQTRDDAALADLTPRQRRNIIQSVQDLGSDQWHGLDASHVWSLWTRYACTAFYAHPLAWQEIGFAGPAYPRGYKNLGLNRLEPFEVRDAHPELDPGAGMES